MWRDLVWLFFGRSFICTVRLLLHSLFTLWGGWFDIGRSKSRGWNNFGRRWTGCGRVLKIGQFSWTSYVYHPLDETERMRDNPQDNTLNIDQSCNTLRLPLTDKTKEKHGDQRNKIPIKNSYNIYKAKTNLRRKPNKRNKEFQSTPHSSVNEQSNQRYHSVTFSH